MRRRSYLRGTAISGTAVIAGCLGLSAPEDDDDSEPTSGDGDNPEDIWQSTEGWNPFEEPTVVEFETAPLTAAVSARHLSTDDGFEVHLDFENGATDETPARLRATVANTRPFDQPLETRRLPIFDNSGRSEDRNYVHLAPTDDHPFADFVPPFEQDDDGRWRIDTRSTSWYPEIVNVPAESAFVGDYYLLGHYQRDATPIAPGYYRLSGGDGLEIALWRTDRPGIDVDSHFAEMEVPPLPRDAETSWYHEATTDTPVVFEPSVERVNLPETIEFTFRNHSHENASGGPSYWRVYKLVDEEWIPIYPWMWSLLFTTVSPGGRRTSTLSLFHDDPISGVGTRQLGYLGGGLYAYEGGYRAGNTTHAALIEVDAPALDLDPMPNVEVEREDDRIVAIHPEYDQSERSSTVSVTKTPDATDFDRVIIPEQLPRERFTAFRVALPLFEERIQRVDVKTDRGSILLAPIFDEGEPFTFRYQDSTYRAAIDMND